MNEKNVKRFISLCIAIFLLIVTVIVSFDFRPYSVGRGTGVDASVTTIKDMSDVMDSYSYISSKNQNLNVASARLTEEKDLKYTSGSVKETTYLSLSESTWENDNDYYNNYDYKNNQSTQTILTRTLYVYYTENATVYHSEGNLSYNAFKKKFYSNSSESSSDQESTSYNLEFNVDLYLSAERVLFKLSKFNYNYFYKKHIFYVK